MFQPASIFASLSLLLSSSLFAQDFQTYGQGCVGSTAVTCPNNNTGAKTLDIKITSSNPQIALMVSAVTPVVQGFEIFTSSTSKKTIKAWILVPDAKGKPITKPFAEGTITVGTTPGWYKAVFPKYVILGARTKYFISWEKGSGLTPATLPPRVKSGRTSVHYEYSFFFPSYQWFGPFNKEKWAWRMNCPGGSKAVPALAASGFPILGNNTYAIDLLNGLPSGVAIALLGSSKTAWGPLTLPFSLSGLGAAGCSVLSSGDVLLPVIMDSGGRGKLPLPIPNNSKFKGVQLQSQWLILDKAANALGITVSNGGTSIIG